MFFVGQKVVCVDDSDTPGRARWNGDKPALGQVYTIARTGLVNPIGQPGIELVEIKNDMLMFGKPTGHVGYRPSRFRPVTDIRWAHKLVQEVFDKRKVSA